MVNPLCLVRPSVGSVGDSYDNALETTYDLYKADVIYRRGPLRNFEAVEFDWFNNRRLLEPVGNKPPAEAKHWQ